MTSFPLIPADDDSTRAEADGSPEAFIAAGAATAAVGSEAFRQVRFEDLPAFLKEQLRTDGMHGGRRTEAEAKELFELRVNAEARGSVEGVQAVAANPEIDAMHIVSRENGGSDDASNLVYGPESLNSSIGSRQMSAAEIAEAEAYTLELAEEATPGVTGNLAEVAGDTLDTGALGGVMGGGLAVAHRWAQVQGFRDAGREDLAAAAEAQMMEDAARGAVNGVVRGTTVAVTQAVLGANPLTAGIGLVAPDVVSLLREKERLSEADVQRRSLQIAGKGALATVLVCAGPVGWLGLAGFSMAQAYQKANRGHGASGEAAPGPA